MALIPPFFLDTVVALGVQGTNLLTAWTATGFLYGRFLQKDNQGQDQYVIYLVTNRHVVQNQKNLVVRFNPQGNESAKDFTLPIVDANGKPLWTAHADASIDISVTELNSQYLVQQNVRYSFFEEDKHVFFGHDIRNGLLSEGDPVYVLGYPMGLVAPDRQYVVSRFGSVSRIRDWKEGFTKDFLIDATIFPGNSGGPVINGTYLSGIVGTRVLERACLVGIVKSYIPYHDRAVSPQTGLTRVVFEENSGLTSVIPTDYVKEVVDLCYTNLRLQLDA